MVIVVVVCALWISCSFSTMDRADAKMPVGTSGSLIEGQISKITTRILV